MSRHYRASVIVAVVVAGAALFVPLAAAPPKVAAVAPDKDLAQGPQPNGEFHSVFVDFERLAAEAGRGEATEIAKFVEHSLQRSIGFAAAPSLGTRLTNAEIAFRQRQHNGISSEDVVRAINDAVGRFDGPRYLRTNLAQVRLVKDILDRRIPHLATISEHGEQPTTNTMSPAEGAFLLMFLATQKVLNGDYQIDPDAWIRETQARMTRPAVQGGGPPTHVRAAKTQVIDEIMPGLAAPPSESSLLTHAVHQIFDDLGVRR